MKNIVQYIILVPIFFFVGRQPVFAQTLNAKERLDSLESRLPMLGDGVDKVRLLLDLAGGYSTLSPEKSKAYGVQGMNLADKIQDYQGMMECRFAVSYVHSITGDWAKGLEVAYENLELVRKFAPHLEAILCSNFSIAYRKQQDFKKALEWSLNALELVSKDPKIVAHPNMYKEVAAAYLHLGKPDSVLWYGYKGMEIAGKLGDFPVEIFFTNMGNAYAQKMQFDSAFHYFFKGRRYFERINQPFTVQEFDCDIANAYMKMGLLDSAAVYAHAAFREASLIENPLAAREAARILANVYERRDIHKAYEFIKKYQTLNDSFASMHKVNQLYQLEYNERKKVSDMEKARLENKSKIRQNALLGISTTIALITLLLGYNNRQKNQANILLQSQKEEINRQKNIAESTLGKLQSTQTQLIQSEKLASLGELTAGIAHEIQNPLNFVNNFSELSVDLAQEIKAEIDKVEIPEKDKAYLDELLTDLGQNQEKINLHGKRAAGIVTGMLQHARTSTGIKEPTDLNALADEYLRLSYHGLRAKDSNFNAKMVTDFDPAVGKVDVIPQDMGRVLLNLINNAFYAVVQRAGASVGVTSSHPDTLRVEVYQPTVTISTQKTDNQIIIKIKDNGTGIPDSAKARIFQPFFTTKPTGQGTGLGLSLAYDIVVKGHGGTLEVTSIEEVGSEFIICLPFKTNGG